MSSNNAKPNETPKSSENTSKTTDTKQTTNTNKTTDKTTTTLVSKDVSATDSIKDLTKTIFSSSNIILVLWFLAAYFIAYAIFGMFNTSLSGPDYMLKIVDLLVLIVMFAYIISYYYYNPTSTKNIQKNAYDTLNDINTLIYSGLFLIVYVLVAVVFRIPVSGAGAPVSLWVLTTFATVLFTITAIVVFSKQVLGISILDLDSLSSLWGGKTEPESTNTTVNTKNVQQNEVFNVSNNLYTYDDARAVCTAFGARLATYDEIEDAYNKGGEWCSYGWSEGQMAYFPTQKSTWLDLQKNPKKKNNCGRPGVNGGYMDNPYIKFGVNCYGKKPKPTDLDLQTMAANKLQPKTEEDMLMEKKVQFWKENKDKLLKLNSFNRNAWSEY